MSIGYWVDIHRVNEESPQREEETRSGSSNAKMKLGEVISSGVVAKT
jgi:hypothetical protein